MKWLTPRRLFLIGTCFLLLDAACSLGLSLATGVVPTGRYFAFWPLSVAFLAATVLFLDRRQTSLDRREESLRMKETALLRYGAALTAREDELAERLWKEGR